MKKKSSSKLAFFTLRVLSGLVAAAFIAFALASSYAVGDTPTATPTPCGIPYTPTPAPGCSNHPTFTVNVCANDGYELVTDVYLKPGNPTPTLPVLVMRGAGARCGTTYPANADYHLVVQDIRPGSGNVNDENFLYSADKDDGQVLLDQIAGPSFPWGNGRLAMQGWSNGGIVTYLAAPGAVSSLRGIQTNFATGDLLNYGLFNGGVLHRETNDLIIQASPTPSPTPSWEDYVGLPDWGKYLITDYDASQTHLAGFHRGGWFDVFGQGTLDSFSRLQKAGNLLWRNRQKVVIGPWIHGGNGVPQPGDACYPLARVGELCVPNATDPRALEYNTKWQSGVFGNGTTDWNDWQALPAVRVYHMGAFPSGTEWKTYTTWPPSPAYEFPLYFATNNTLSSGATPLPQFSGQVPFTSNPSNPCPTRGGTNNLISCVWPSPAPSPTPPVSCGPMDQRPIENDRTRHDFVLFTSIAGPAFIVGRIHADVWIQTTLPDVDVFVRMTDVYPSPDNRSMLMAQGIQRARYRNGACPILPLNLTQPTLVRVDLGSTALVLPADHKLRVIVSASAGPPGFGSRPFDPLYSVNPQNGDEYIGEHPNMTGSINVYCGGTHASALYIPVPSASATPQPDRRPNTTPCPN